MRTTTAVASLLLLGLTGRALAIVSVGVVDGSASLAEVAPVSGASVARWSTSDGLRFSNDGSTEGELIVYTATHSFARDSDGSTATDSVSYQGVTTTLAENLFAAQSSTGDFLPLRVVTSTDLTGEAGWTKDGGCGTVTYQGSLSIAWSSNAGVAQTSLVRYYQVCDAGAELYLDADKALASGADLAYSTTTQRVLPNEADYELSIQGTDFVFASAASATAVTLQQGRHVGSGFTSPTTVDTFLLYRFPDGFPAGATTTTLTATATDITL